MAQIATLRALVGHRLHAHIIGLALGISTVALTWDRKVESFFRSVDRQRYLVPTEQATTDHVTGLLHSASTDGPAEGAIEDLIRQQTEAMAALDLSLKHRI